VYEILEKKPEITEVFFALEISEFYLAILSHFYLRETTKILKRFNLLMSFYITFFLP